MYVFYKVVVVKVVWSGVNEYSNVTLLTPSLKENIQEFMCVCLCDVR